MVGARLKKLCDSGARRRRRGERIQARSWYTPPVMRTLVSTSVCVLLSLALAGCGGSGPAPSIPAAAAPAAGEAEQGTEKPAANQPSFGAEYGGMNEERVAKVFSSTYDALGTCLEEGSQGMPYLAGAVYFYLEVDASGTVVHAHMEKSDLGDRDISLCMLDVLRKQSWPAPVGGKFGKIQSNMTFSPQAGVNQPTAWEAHQVASAVGELAEPIEQCKAGVTGTFTATAYVGTLMRPAAEGSKDGPTEVGKMMAVDVTPPSKEGAAAIDCLVKVLRSGTYPSPGQVPAKVTFPL